MGNLNLNLSIPIIQKKGRGTNFSYSLVYDSSVWHPAVVSGTSTWTPIGNFGWKAGAAPSLGTVTFSTTLTSGTCTGDSGRKSRLTIYTYGNFVYTDKFGASHPFDGTAQEWDCSGGDDYYEGGFKATASDGSGYTLDTSLDLPGQVYDRTGAKADLGKSTYTDANGNQINISNGVFTDTLGTTALTVSGSATPTSPIQMQYTAPGGAANAKLMYTAYNVKTAFGCDGVHEYSASTNLASQLVLGDGTSYSFAYEPTPGYPGYVTGRIASITLPTGGTTSITYNGSGTGISNGIVCSDGSTAGVQIQTPDGTTNYARSGADPSWTTTITYPDANSSQTVISFQKGSTTSNFYEAKRLVYQGSSTLLKTVNTCYNGATPDCSSTAITLPVLERTTYCTLGSKQSKYDIFYNVYGLVTVVKAYDFGNVLLKNTSISYATLGNNINDRPYAISVLDGSGTLAAQTSSQPVMSTCRIVDTSGHSPTIAAQFRPDGQNSRLLYTLTLIVLA